MEWDHSAPEVGENTNFLGYEPAGSACAPGEGREAVLNVYHATYLYAESQLDDGRRGVEGELTTHNSIAQHSFSQTPSLLIEEPTLSRGSHDRPDAPSSSFALPFPDEGRRWNERSPVFNLRATSY